MIHIQKQRTPATVKQRAVKLISAPENDYKEITLPKDTKKLRDLFDQMPKADIGGIMSRAAWPMCLLYEANCAPEVCFHADRTL